MHGSKLKILSLTSWAKQRRNNWRNVKEVVSPLNKSAVYFLAIVYV